MFASFKWNQKQTRPWIFFSRNIERFLHLDPEDCKNELKRSKNVENKNHKLVNFQGFPNSAQQASFEHHQGHVQLDDKLPYHGAHGCLTYDLHKKNWRHDIEINNSSNCKADKKHSGYQEAMFLIGKFNSNKFNKHEI